METITITAIIALLIPSTAFMFIVVKQIKQQTNRDKTRNSNELKKDRQSYFLPHRVEAHQRIVLFLERISPNSLIMRKFNATHSAKSLQSELLETIREEFEHNIAQQLFISADSWVKVKNSKEEIIKLINLAASQMKENSTAIDLSAKIFEISAQINPLPTEITNKILINELQSLF